MKRLLTRLKRRLQSTRQKQAITAPQSGGGCRRGGGGTAKERGRIDKGPPRRRQSGADGCPLSDEANCRTCPQRGQELYEKRKKTKEPPRSRRTRDDLWEAPPQWSVPPNDGSQGQISFALGNLSPLRGGKPRGHEGERLGGERPAAARVADKGRENQDDKRSKRPSNKQQKNDKKGKGWNNSCRQRRSEAKTDETNR